MTLEAAPPMSASPDTGVSVDPYSAVPWSDREASITDAAGAVPLSSGAGKKAEVAPTPVALPVRQGRRPLPSERASITRKFSIAGHEGYVTVGLYDDGTPGELFVTMAKEGSTISGMIDAFAIAISHCLQYGVPALTHHLSYVVHDQARE